MQNVKDKGFLNKLGARVKKLRLERNLSQLDLGVLMDNYAEQIGRIERGQLNVSICTLKKLSESLQIPLKDLLDF